MIHLCKAIGIKTSRSVARIRTTLQVDAAARAHGDSTPQPLQSLRDRLAHLAARDSMVVLKPGIGPRFSRGRFPNVREVHLARHYRTRPIQQELCTATLITADEWCAMLFVG
jgi:hypothetical protein